MSTKRAFLGARVSTTNQKDNTSLDAQILAMRQYCEQKGYAIIEEMQETHTGSDDERPSLQRVRELARAKQIDVMIVYSIDRFMRDFTKAVITEHELAKLGVVVEYLNLPPDDSMGYRLVKNTLQILADEERRIITQRMLKGKYDSVRGGKVITSNPPYGYAFNADRDNFCINDYESQIVERIFDMCISGMSTRKIAETLSNEHIPTWTDLRNVSFSTKKSGYGVWAAHTITDLLHDRTYIGEFTLQGKDNATCPVPPIIDTCTFIQAQQAIEKRRKAPNNSNKHKFLMRGMLFCGECGRPLSVSYKKFADRDKAYKYYMCYTIQGKKDYDGESCTLPYVNAETLDNAVLDWIYTELPNRMALIEKYRKYVENNGQSNINTARLEAIAELIQRAKVRRDREIQLYRNGFSDIDNLKSNTFAIDNEIKSLETERDAITQKQSELPVLEIFDSYVEKLHDKIESTKRGGSFEDIRGLLEILSVWGTVYSVRKVSGGIHVYADMEANLLGEKSFLVLETES